MPRKLQTAVFLASLLFQSKFQVGKSNVTNIAKYSLHIMHKVIYEDSHPNKFNMKNVKKLTTKMHYIAPCAKELMTIFVTSTCMLIFTEDKD